MDEDAVLRSETDFFVEFVPALDFLSSCLCVCVCVCSCVCVYRCVCVFFLGVAFYLVLFACDIV